MKKILLKDGNPRYLQLSSSVLSKDLQKVTTASVAGAMNVLETMEVDAVCSDFRETTERIRQSKFDKKFCRILSDDF